MEGQARPFKFRDKLAGLPGGVLPSASVIADGFYRTAFHRFLAKLLFFGSRGLLVNVGVAAIIIAAKITRGGLAAEVTVNASGVDIESARNVFGHLFGPFGHWSHALSSSATA